MWWNELERIESALRARSGEPAIAAGAKVHPTAIVEGAVRIGPRTIVGAHARIVGPVEIGADCLIGDHAFLRGPVHLSADVRIGFATELKSARCASGVRIGPQCFVADSLVDEEAYLGAQVRTSNHRLDAANVSVMVDGKRMDTGREKLGAHIGARAALGIQCIVLPGRIVAPGSVFAPRIIIEKNLPQGRYRLAQQLVAEGIAA